MNFKQIELAGFKSFADKLTIKFEPGITAIVGPNGCGKSNVADAIRWVLGEQSTKLLRGSSMQDVIFNGTQNRKSLSYCEVSLVFDNTNRNFNLDFNEVVLTRKLYRSGESEYLINRTPCRLKDIVNALHDSGIGRDGYSIIGQGKVEEIISSKPENRRAIFEEAAGISKFKSKKVEAERKLERTQDNLGQVQIVLSELERQLGPLKKQAENAKKYLELKQDLKNYEVNTYIYQYETASDTKQKIQNRIDALLEEIGLKQTAIDQANRKYNDNMQEIDKIDKTIDELHNKILTLTVSLEKRAGEANVVKERIKFLTEEQQQRTNDLNKQNLNLQNAQILLDNNKNKKQSQQNLLDSLKKQAEEISNKYLEIVDELTHSEDEAAEKQKQMIDALSKLTDIKSNLSALKAEKEAYSLNVQDLDKKIEVLNQKIKSREQERKTIENDAQKSYNNYIQAKKDLDERNQKLADLKQQIEENSQTLNTTSSNIQILENRKKVLEDMQKDYDGFNYSVKRLMQDSETNRNLKDKIVGVVASSMTIPKGFETAIEVALGNAIQNIITSNEQDSKELINYLKQNNLGRATFLPIATMKAKGLNSAEELIIKTKNCHGVASNIIKYDKSLANIFNSLLGRTVIVEDINDAVNLAKKSNFAFKIVTLDGDVINPQGSISGGSKKAITSNILMRDAEIETLTSQLEKLREKFKDCQQLKLDLDKKLSILNSEIEKANELVVSTQVQNAQKSQLLDQFNIYVEEHDKERISLSQERMQIAERIELITKAISQVDQNGDIKATNDAQENIEARQKIFNDLKVQRDKYHEDMTSIKVNIASIESEITALDAEIERLEAVIEQTNANIEEQQQSLEKLNNTIKGAMSIVEVNQDQAKYDKTVADLEQVKQKMAGLDDYKQKLQQEIKALDEERNSLTSEQNRALDKKYQEDMALAKVDTDIEAMQERIFEEYELTYATCLELKQENYDLQDGLVNTSRIKKEISRLGYVNVNAIEESKLVGERYEEMNTQAQDLIKARDDLIQIIKELATEMITKFETEFAKIQANFSKIFKELFGGGNAKLELTEHEDPLQAGVEIVAEPPGKKLQSITLLSGGEKALTAIAILFAILRLRPMPFCLLDEIEAALDDANVERFATYLKRFSQETQFIVITHRKPTMELADSLYGVTMEEKGVSKLVSVKLSEAVKNAK